MNLFQQLRSSGTQPIFTFYTNSLPKCEVGEEEEEEENLGYLWNALIIQFYKGKGDDNWRKNRTPASALARLQT